MYVCMDLITHASVFISSSAYKYSHSYLNIKFINLSIKLYGEI